jgi:hypothetical protein
LGTFGAAESSFDAADGFAQVTGGQDRVELQYSNHADGAVSILS